LLYKLEVSGRWIPKPVQLAGQESLLVYGVHLWIIFGLLRGKGLGPILGKQMGYFPCFLLSAAIIVAMLLLARYWHTLKKNYPSYVRRGQAVVVLIMLAVFLLS
jgi:fucose 4-O-acetylase-like acetyltransferase